MEDRYAEMASEREAKIATAVQHWLVVASELNCFASPENEKKVSHF